MTEINGELYKLIVKVSKDTEKILLDISNSKTEILKSREIARSQFVDLMSEFRHATQYSARVNMRVGYLLILFIGSNAFFMLSLIASAILLASEKISIDSFMHVLMMFTIFDCLINVYCLFHHNKMTKELVK